MDHLIESGTDFQCRTNDITVPLHTMMQAPLPQKNGNRMALLFSISLNVFRTALLDRG